MHILDLEAGSTQEEMATRRQRVMARGEDHFESRHRRKDGSIFDVEVSIQYRPSDGGGMMAFVQDITERKRAKEALLAQENFFEQMFMQSSISTQILDADGWCERINPKLGEIFGVRPQSIEGKVYNIFQDAAIQRGGLVYRVSCQTCHGEGGRGERGFIFEGDTLRPPSFVSASWSYAKDPVGLRRRIFTGSILGMPYWGLVGLTFKDVDAVARYITTVLR